MSQLYTLFSATTHDPQELLDLLSCLPYLKPVEGGLDGPGVAITVRSYNPSLPLRFRHLSVPPATRVCVDFEVFLDDQYHDGRQSMLLGVAMLLHADLADATLLYDFEVPLLEHSEGRLVLYKGPFWDEEATLTLNHPFEFRVP